MRVQDVMSRNVETVEAGASVAEARDVMKTRGIRHLVVRESGAITGVVSSHDVKTADGVVADVMSRHVLTLPSNATLSDAANTLRGHAIGCLPVLDGKKLVGIVTISDLLEVMGKGGGRAHDRARPYLARRQGAPKKARGERLVAR